MYFGWYNEDGRLDCSRIIKILLIISTVDANTFTMCYDKLRVNNVNEIELLSVSIRNHNE